jgi:hypothetical protein
MGVEHVEKLAGDREPKARLKTILRVLAGELSVNEGAEQLGVCPSRFHELRDEALRGALDALAPKTPGRPRSARSPGLRELDLEQELDATRYQLEVERVRTQLLLTMPEVVVGKARPPRVEGGNRGGGGSNKKR